MQVNRPIETIEDKTETFEDRLQVLSLWVTIYLQEAVFVCPFGDYLETLLGRQSETKVPYFSPELSEFQTFTPVYKRK